MKASIPTWLMWLLIGIAILVIVLGGIWIVRSGILENWLPQFNFVSPI
jgi:uncharacterized protein YneF (UPF0154 family)